MNDRKFACSAARERGTRTNTRIIADRTIEARVLDGIAARLLAPDSIAEAVSLAQAEATQRQHETLRSRAPMEKELAEIAGLPGRMQDLCITEAISIEDLKAKSTPLKARRTELEALLAEAETPAVLSLLLGVAEACRRMARQLREALDDTDGGDARNAVRALIETVVSIPTEGPDAQKPRGQWRRGFRGVSPV